MLHTIESGVAEELQATQGCGAAEREQGRALPGLACFGARMDARSRSGKKGMTLIEIMVVMVILGLLATVIGMKVFDSLEEAKVQTAKTQAQSLVGALSQFRLKCGSYPSAEQGIQALVEAPTSGKACKRYPTGGFLDRLPKDPWDNDYQYANPGTHNVNGVDVWSMGKDGESGNEDDIGNWEDAAKEGEGS